MTVSYSAFGELRVTVEGVTTSIRRRRERQVLATPMATRGAAVSADRLAMDLWGPDAGPSVLGLVQVAVSRLRSLIEPDRTARGGQLIVSTTAGYQLEADPRDVDVWHFEDLARQALEGPLPAGQVVSLCEEASALWSAPYAGVEAPATDQHAEQLHEVRADLVAHHARALLDLGNPDATVRLLSPVIDEHPYRESLWGLQALAQYRCGRQADALATLRRLRKRLADDLGVDPVAETVTLEGLLLRQDDGALSEPLLTHHGAHSPGRVAAAVQLFGRADELATGMSLLSEAIDEQHSRFLLVAGEPGIGKSAYLTALAAGAVERGFEVLAGHGYEDDLAPALWPWIEITRSVLDEAPRSIRDVLEPITTEQNITNGGGGPVLPVYEAVLQLLIDRARRRPVLVIIEDLGFTDTATLRLLRHVAEASPRVPLVVAVSRRTTTEPTKALLAVLAALSRAGVARVRLDGLRVEAVGELISAVAGPHSPELDRHVATITGGNPFFVQQYAALLAERTDLAELDPTDLSVPQGIRAVLREHFSRLPAETVTVLLSASVLGRIVSPELLAATVERPVDEVLSCLEAGTAAGLFVEDNAGYTFVHDLAVTTASEELGAARRIRLHDRAGRILEERRGTGSDSINAIAAHTWAAAGLSPEHLERAATWRARAAGMALVRHAYVEALALWTDVLEVVPGDSEAAARAHQGAGTALLNLSRVAEAQREIEAGTRLAHDLRDWNLVTELASTQATMAPWSWPRPGPDQSAFDSAINDALVHGHPGLQALLLVVRDIGRLTSGATEPRGEDTVAALALARQIGDPGLLQFVMVFSVMATDSAWPAPKRLELVEELLTTHPEGDTLVGSLFLAGLVHWYNGNPDACDESMAHAQALAREIGFSRMNIPFLWWAAVRARDRDADDADALLDIAVEQHRRAGSFQADDAIVIAIARRDHGHQVLDRLPDCPTAQSPAVGTLLAHAILEAGEPSLARQYLDMAIPPGTAGEHLDIATQCFRLLVLASTGTPEEIRAAIEPLESRRGESVVVINVLDHAGVVDHFLAAGYAALGDDRAAEAAATALRANEALGCLPWVRRSAALVQSLG